MWYGAWCMVPFPASDKSFLQPLVASQLHSFNVSWKYNSCNSNRAIIWRTKADKNSEIIIIESIMGVRFNYNIPHNEIC
jgi:hypothetical protein